MIHSDQFGDTDMNCIGELGVAAISTNSGMSLRDGEYLKARFGRPRWSMNT
ncbi:hypothetical protein IMCC12053_431 [Celeribacter marinus]|uniref:Uncharacterized protein n=1 Tax=Celeribacter marinus TaxID=1397108 RepID=A0A0P0A7K8_9RHOB|nr:hypothetical protein IMCC12053_431 [Celeribacter marinus]